MVQERRRQDDAWRENVDRQLESNTRMTAAVSRDVNKLSTAMFAETPENEFGTLGVMTTMRRLNLHIDMVCKISMWAKTALATILSLSFSGLMLYKLVESLPK